MAAEWLAAIGALLIPAFLLVATLSHMPEAADAAQTLATESARSAAQADSCGQASTAVNEVAFGTNGAPGLAEALHLKVTPSDIDFDGSQWQAGGSVKVSVTTEVTVYGWQVPVPITRTHVEPIDKYRFLDTGGC